MDYQVLPGLALIVSLALSLVILPAHILPDPYALAIIMYVNILFRSVNILCSLLLLEQRTLFHLSETVHLFLSILVNSLWSFDLF